MTGMDEVYATSTRRAGNSQWQDRHRRDARNKEADTVELVRVCGAELQKTLAMRAPKAEDDNEQFAKFDAYEMQFITCDFIIRKLAKDMDTRAECARKSME